MAKVIRTLGIPNPDNATQYSGAAIEFRNKILSDQDLMYVFGFSHRQQMTKLRYHRSLPYTNLAKGLRVYCTDDIVKWIKDNQVILNPKDIFGEEFLPEEEGSYEEEDIKELENKTVKVPTSVFKQKVKKYEKKIKKRR